MRLNMRFALLVAATMLVASPLMAVVITPVDLQDHFDAGDLGINCSPFPAGTEPFCDGSKFPILTNTFQSPAPATTIGFLTNGVYWDETSGVWTYVETALPARGKTVSVFSTGFPVNGFTGEAGWLFSSAFANGLANDASAFTIDFQADGTLDWIIPPGGGWTPQPGVVEGISFYYQSTIAPGSGPYNLSADKVGTGESYAPVPEPSTVFLIGLGLAGIALVGRKYPRSNK